MSHKQTVDLDHKDRVPRFTFFVCRMAGDKNVADLIFPGAFYDKGFRFDPGQITVSGLIVAHRDNIRLQFQRFITDFFIVIRIANNASEISFINAETRMSVPGNIHQSSNKCASPDTGPAHLLED